MAGQNLVGCASSEAVDHVMIYGCWQSLYAALMVNGVCSHLRCRIDEKVFLQHISKVAVETVHSREYTFRNCQMDKKGQKANSGEDDEVITCRPVSPNSFYKDITAQIYLDRAT